MEHNTSPFDGQCVQEVNRPIVTKYWTKYVVVDSETGEMFTVSINRDGKICSIEFGGTAEPVDETS